MVVGGLLGMLRGLSLFPVTEVDSSHPSSSFYAPVSSCEREADSYPPNSAFGSLVAGEI